MTSGGHVGSSVAVIGAGIFGSTVAVELAEAGFDVTVYEKRDDILSGTSARNMFRMHRGYHYPRHEPTARQARDGYDSFAGRFGAAIVKRVPQYYAVARAGSAISPREFEAHAARLGLRMNPSRPHFVDWDAVAACYEVDEDYYDVGVLRDLLRGQLKVAGVEVRLQTTADARLIATSHDYVVIAAYDSMNDILQQLGFDTQPLQHELCEIAVIRCSGLSPCSVTIMDGPFTSLSPYSNDKFLLCDVGHSVHERVVTTGKPRFAQSATSRQYELTAAHPGSQFDAIAKAGARYIPALRFAQHIGSLYAPRVVLPDVDETDARPTLVRWAGSKVLTVFSGKVSVAVNAAREVVSALQSTTSREPTAQARATTW